MLKTIFIAANNGQSDQRDDEKQWFHSSGCPQALHLQPHMGLTGDLECILRFILHIMESIVVPL